MSRPPGVTMSAKLFAVERSAPAAASAGNVDADDTVVAAFHRWIRDEALSEQLPIDVADYRHVHGGPGVVLACHRGLLSFGGHGGRSGLRFEHKSPSDSDPGTLLRLLLRTVGAAGLLLEQEDGLRGRVVFSADRLEIRLQDRLRAPHRAPTLANLRERLEPVVAKLCAGAAAVQWRDVLDPDLGSGFDVHVEAGPDLHVLVARARGAP